MNYFSEARPWFVVIVVSFRLLGNVDVLLMFELTAINNTGKSFA